MGAVVSVVSLSAAPVGWLVWQRPPHAPVLTVAIRATFALRPGEATLAPEQEPLIKDERAYPDGSSRGLYAPCDLVPMKPRADVVVVGQAFAPGRQPVRSLVARVSVGDMEKRVEVFCDRHFDQQGALREGPRFTAMPLTYERAAGGPDTTNPIGLRGDARDMYGRLALPNLQPTGVEIATPTQTIAPIGLGPIPSAWPSRRALLGPQASALAPGPWQGPTVAADLDPSHFLAAPHDQQVQALREDERIALGNLHPDHPELVTRLPGLRPHTFVEGRGAPIHVTMRADTLWIDTTRQICTVTWRGQLALEPAAPALRAIVALTPADRPLGWEEVARLAARIPHREAAHDLGTTHDDGPGASDGTHTLVMMGGDPPYPPAQPVTMGGSPAPQASGRRPKARTLPFSITPPEARTPRDPAVGGGLPFRRPGEAAPAPLPAPPPPVEQTVDEEVPATVAPQAAAMPYPPAPPAQPAPTPAPAEPAFFRGGGDSQAPAPPAAPVESIWARGAAPMPSALKSEPPPGPPLAAFTPRPTVGESSPPPALPAIEAPRQPPAPARSGVGPLHLSWFTREILPALRVDPRFTWILDALDGRPLDRDLDDTDDDADVADVDERREVFEILARGEATGEEGVAAALSGAVRGDGRFVQPIVLLAGELAFPFDEVEALKATLSAAAPSAGVDPEARAILGLAKEFLASPGQPSAPAVAEGLATRIRDTFEKRSLVTAGFLEAQIARALLVGRKHQRRRVLGAPHVRALFLTGDAPGIPTYLDADTVANLPATERLRARMLAHAHPTLDQNETHPAALRAVALAVVTPPLARR